MELCGWTVVLVPAILLMNATGSLAQFACGQAPFNTKIVGGQNANTGAWPWQASLQYGGFHFCGGSLINNKWILSAAHCFQSSATNDPAKLTVKLGMASLEGSNPNSVDKSVSQIVVHPSYNSNTQNNDIALLQLSSTVTFNNYIQPVCLAASGSTLDSGTYVWVTGWGNIGSDVSLPSPMNLQEVEVPIVSNTNCANSYGSGSITSNMLCAGLAQGGKDSCQGDSGGPMVIIQSDGWTQAGVVSFGYGCAQPNFPGVYARVSQYNTWINSNVGDNPPGYVSISGSGSKLFSLPLSLFFCIVPFLVSLFIFS